MEQHGKSSGVGVRADVSWIIVAHDSAAELDALLPELVTATDALADRGLRSELIIVDNASCDDARDLVGRLAPHARWLRNARNLGYGGALNRAAAQARGRWLACCNADLRIPPGGLDRLPQALAAAGRDIVLLGPALLGPDGRPDRGGGRFPTLLRLLGGLLRPARRGPGVAGADPGAAGARGVEWIDGACLLARRHAFLQAGGFDEAFFLYYEDADLALRLRRLGGRAVIDPALSVVHVRPHHGRARRDAETERIVRASRRVYFARHRPAWERRALALLERLEPRVRPADARRG